MSPAPLRKVELASWKKTCLIIGKVEGDFEEKYVLRRKKINQQVQM